MMCRPKPASFAPVFLSSRLPAAVPLKRSISYQKNPSVCWSATSPCRRRMATLSLAVFVRALAGGWQQVTPRVVIATIVFVALYGASDELHQYFNPPRHVEILDVVADTIGGGLASIGLYAWGIIQARDGL